MTRLTGSPAPARIRDVASLARTSVSTVSNFLNGRPERMRPDTVRRVEAAISSLQYQPNWAARSLKLGTVPVIGLLVPSVANPSHGALARAVEVAAEERGFQVVLGNSLRDRERERRYAADFLALGLRGIIVASSPLSLDHFAEYMEQGLSVVVVDRGEPAGHDDGAIDSVTVDNRRAGYLAARHLIDLGHRRIAYVSGATRTASRQSRFLGYQDALSEAGLLTDPALVTISEATFGFDDTHAAEHGRIAARELLGRVRPSAVVAMNDMHALGACAAARDLGLSVPHDLSVVGIDDILLGSIANPPLTTVHQPFDALGRAAVESLLDRFTEGPTGPGRHIVMQPTLVARASAITLETSNA